MKTLRCLFLVENLDLAAATGVPDAVWEPFQLRHLNDDGTFRIENKSRQIAWSWLSAAEGVANAVLDGQSSMYVSINLEEAREKIRYAKNVYESLRVGGLPAITIDNQFNLEFSNGARLISAPSRPPRGRARFNVYLDEFAHAMLAAEIYTASLPIVSKGGRLRIGSTPYGQRSTFWEVFTQKMRPYPDYTRATTPWWLVQSMCADVRTARVEAPKMTQAERVERFGQARLIAIWRNMLEEDFAQEYECSFVDESTAWIGWDELRSCQDEMLIWEHVTCTGAHIDKALEAVDRLAARVADRRVEYQLVAGMDVGRKRDVTEIVITGVTTTRSYPVRLVITLDCVPFDDQAEVVKRIMTVLPVIKMYIDRNGIGMQIAEQLESRFPVKVEGATFTVQSKAQWATEAKMLVQQRRVVVPVDRDFQYQVHSIKRRPSAVGMLYDTERNEQHHADRFWAWALALWAGSKLFDVGDVVRVVSRRAH